MKNKYNHILSAEGSFARRVTLAEIVSRSVNPWLQMIPGMFIFDFLKRTTEIRRYSNYFMFPRRLALDLCMGIIQGQQREQSLLQAGEKIKAWLGTSILHSPAIIQSYNTILHFLIDHYIKLLQSDGNTYHDLVKDAYKTLETYDAFLESLTTAEQGLEKAVREILGDNEHTKRMTKQWQVEEQRIKEKQVIF